MRGREYLRRLEPGEPVDSRHDSNWEQAGALQRRRLDRFRKEQARATTWRRTSAGFVIFALVGISVGVLTGLLFTEWVMRMWPDRLPLLRP
jgi:hypothetical protein